MKILIVEDEIKLAKSLKQALQTEGFIVDVASDGQEAYLKVFDEYDLILLDIGLPGMDGIELAKKIRAEHLSTPILMLTARDTTQNKITGLDAGADDYLVKPFEFDELLARIRALMRRNSQQKNLLYQIDTLVLDPQKKVVSRNGTEIELSAKEYAVLEYLMRYPQQIVSKQQLIDHCWDSSLDPFSNTVDVYIGYVRNKIDKAFPDEKPLLKTVKGLGYRIG